MADYDWFPPTDVDLEFMRKEVQEAERRLRRLQSVYDRLVYLTTKKVK